MTGPKPRSKIWVFPIVAIIALVGARLATTTAISSAGLSQIPPGVIEEIKTSFQSATQEAPRQVTKIDYDGLIMAQGNQGVIPKGTKVFKLILHYSQGSSVPGCNAVFVWKENSGNWRYLEGHE
jgi:hypothetical protein